MISLQKYIKRLPSQENIGCCTASASLLSAELILSQFDIDLTFSRLFVYYMARKLGNRLGKRGAELQHTLEAMSDYGCALNKTWPHYYNLVEKEPSILSYQEAVNYKVNSFQSVNINEFKQYLETGIPVIIGLHTGRKFWKLKGKFDTQQYTPVNSTDNMQFRGHAVTVIGYDDSLQGGVWIIANSLGLTWGDHGLGVLPYSCNVDIGEAYVITNFANKTPDRKILIIDK